MNAIEKLIKRIEDLFKSRFFYRSLGNKSRDIIYKRTKAGFGVTSDKSRSPRREKLARLTSQQYKKFRRTVPLGAFGRPGKSNLTLTGQMLDSMRVKTTSNGFKLDIPRTSRRNVYGGRDKYTNNEILQFTRKTRPFFALTVAEQRIIVQKISDELNKKLNITINEEI